MFMRVHQIGPDYYNEVLESFRDPKTGKPKHRLVVRWKRHGDHDNDIQHTLARARTAQRRAKAELAWAESEAAIATVPLVEAPPTRPDGAVPMWETVEFRRWQKTGQGDDRRWLAHRLAVRDRCQRALARIEARIAKLVTAQAALRSGRRARS